MSLRIITLLYHACRNLGKQRFTSSELADFLGVTPRTVNRILAKLIDHHLAQDVSRSFTGKSGRPAASSSSSSRRKEEEVTSG